MVDPRILRAANIPPARLIPSFTDPVGGRGHAILRVGGVCHAGGCICGGLAGEGQRRDVWGSVNSRKFHDKPFNAAVASGPAFVELPTAPVAKYSLRKKRSGN